MTISEENAITCDLRAGEIAEKALRQILLFDISKEVKTIISLALAEIEKEHQDAESDIENDEVNPERSTTSLFD